MSSTKTSMSSTKTSENKKFLDLLTSRYKREILEELVDNPDYTFTVNELAGKVSGSYNSVNKFLRHLEEYSIVSFRKKGGTYLVEYNHDSKYHEVIKTVLKADNTPLENAAEEYAEKLFRDSYLEQEIVSLILFGSVARGTAKTNSDIDILILVNDDTDIEKVEKKSRKYAHQAQPDFEVVPVVETVKEFRNNLAHGKRFENNVAKDGIVLKGEELEFEN